MRLSLLAAAIKKPFVKFVNRYWDDVISSPFVDANGIVRDRKRAVISSNNMGNGIGRFGGACMRAVNNSQFTTASTPTQLLQGDFTIEAHVLFEDLTNPNQYIFDFGSNGLSLKYYLNQGGWVVQTGGNVNVVKPNIVPVINRWYHVALVRFRGVVTLYIDGVSIASATHTNGYAGPNMTWGNYGGGGSYNMYGRIDQARVTLMARYTANFTPPSVPFEMGVVEADFDPHWSKVIMLTKGATDAKGLNTFAASGGAVSDSGAARFGGSSMKFVAGSLYTASYAAGTHDLGTGDFTIECWVKPQFMNGVYYVMGRRAGTTTGGWMLQLNSMRPVFSLNYGAAGDLVVGPIANSEIPANEWTHIAISRVNTDLRMFINGKQVSFSPMGQGINMQASSTPFTIGGASGQTSFLGNIDRVRITKGQCRYAADFSMRLVNDLPVIQNGAVLDDADLNYGNVVFFLPGTDESMAERRQQLSFSPRTGNSLDTVNTLFGKPTLKINTGSTAGCSYTPGRVILSGAEWTVETWVKTNYNQAALTQTIIGQWSSAGAMWLFGIRNGKAVFWYDGSSSVDSPANIADGAWHHVAVVRKNGVITLYVDGVAQASANWANPFTYSGAVTLGYQPNSTVPTGFTVNLSNLRITNGFARYAANFAKPEVEFPRMAHAA